MLFKCFQGCVDLVRACLRLPMVQTENEAKINLCFCTNKGQGRMWAVGCRVLGLLTAADVGLGWEKSYAGTCTQSPCPNQWPAPRQDALPHAVAGMGFWVLLVGGRNQVSLSPAGCCHRWWCWLPVSGASQSAASPTGLQCFFFLPEVLLLSFSMQHNCKVICITCTLCQILKICRVWKGMAAIHSAMLINHN